MVIWEESTLNSGEELFEVFKNPGWGKYTLQFWKVWVRGQCVFLVQTWQSDWKWGVGIFQGLFYFKIQMLHCLRITCIIVWIYTLSWRILICGWQYGWQREVSCSILRMWILWVHYLSIIFLTSHKIPRKESGREMGPCCLLAWLLP